MSIISPSDQDIAKIQAATSAVIGTAIQQATDVLVPAIGNALKNATSGMTVTIGPITIEPIKITIGGE